MTSREHILSRIRGALGRKPEQKPPVPPAIRLRPLPMVDRVARFKTALEELGGKVAEVATPAEAGSVVEEILHGRAALASNESILRTCGILSLAGVSTQFSREACASVEVGITSADYALADTGTLVVLTESQETRTLSLLPPCHIALIDRSRFLTGLDELFTLVPKPADASSAMILITGPSRTADIEMRLVRGVHGPGELHVVVVYSSA